MEAMLRHARELTPPSFAAYLEFGCVSGLRPGEIDALPWENIRWYDHEIDVRVQWLAKLREFDIPKYGLYTVALTARARAVLLNMKREQAESPFVFATIRGTHYTPSSRTTIGTACARPPDSAIPRSTWRPGTTSAGTRSTCSAWNPPLSPSSLATRMAGSLSNSSTDTPIERNVGSDYGWPTTAPDLKGERFDSWRTGASEKKPVRNFSVRSGIPLGAQRSCCTVITEQ